jgi:hypothetical protein
MAKRGQINEPTRVLGFTDYTRIYSDDTSLGEMTDQVRQFFQNGGQTAFIVRVALGAGSSFVTLRNEADDADAPSLSPVRSRRSRRLGSGMARFPGIGSWMR